MGGDQPRVPPMAPTQLSKTLRDSENISWVPLKCRYFTIGKYSNITPADFIKYGENGENAPPDFYKPTKANTLDNKRPTILTTHLSTEELLSEFHKENKGLVQPIIDNENKLEKIIDKKLDEILQVNVEKIPNNDHDLIIKVENEINKSVSDLDKKKCEKNGSVLTLSSKKEINNEGKTVVAANNATKTSRKSQRNKTKKSGRQPMKTFCCCWSVPKTKEVRFKNI